LGEKKNTQAHPHPLVQLEALKFKQSLVLFAPQTVNVAGTVAFLRAQFSSPYVVLKRAAVLCLRQLAQLNAKLVSGNQLEEQLFMMVMPSAIPSTFLNSNSLHLFQFLHLLQFPPSIPPSPFSIPCGVVLVDNKFL
jgi:hypothetical protein